MEKITHKVLALKYRPASFKDLIGQDIMVETITNSIKLNKLPNAYLLTGIRGVGKTTTARLIAKALNCKKNFLKEACQKFPNRIALGLDVKDGYLSVSGWKENSNQLTLDYLKEVNDYGVSRLIYTDINRDGMKQSPNFDETSKIAQISNFPVVISGGVSSIDDIKKAKTLKNIEGIIVGKAIYDSDIKLDELARELD